MDYNQADSPLFKLLMNGKHHRLPKGQVLYVTADTMLLNVVKTGYIKRYLITNDGDHSMQAIYGPGDIFPLTPVFKAIFNKDIYRGPEVYYYEAMTDANVYSINQTTLLENLEKDTMLYKDLLNVSGVRLQSNIERLENMSLRVAQRRIAHLLVHLVDKFGEKTEHGTKILVPLTHQNIADLLDITRETVNRRIVRLEEKGLIITGKNIVVPDIEKLRREAH
jgi:CRP-like cAMP-binding protein